MMLCNNDLSDDITLGLLPMDMLFVLSAWLDWYCASAAVECLSEEPLSISPPQRQANQQN